MSTPSRRPPALKKRKLSTPSVPRTAKGMLDLLDQFFAAQIPGSHQGIMLWNVLSALRGPDRDDVSGGVKYATTARIRALAFPEAVKAGGFLRSHVSLNLESKSVHRSAGESISHHFGEHVDFAANALEEMGRVKK